ncbi:MAG: hypothetical protein RL211_2273 [Pseudomonadota bacterium]|jgi:zona occludens toxin
MSITLVTGLPGSGKTLLTVGELLPQLMGQFIERDGQRVNRPLKCNINGLLLEHDRINADDLATWPDWAKAGDVICFDEVQETWRPRAMTTKTPDAVAKLETHRHLGVDFVLMTQHPMLLDQNIRRLVDRHIHVRRVANFGAAVLYEWDHCSNPSMVKSALATRPWRYPKAAFKNYKSSQLHTKRPRRLPAAGLILIAAVVGLGYFGNQSFARLTDRFSSDKKPEISAQGYISKTEVKAYETTDALQPAPFPVQPISAPSAPPVPSPSKPLIAGCVWVPGKCSCFDSHGFKVDPEKDSCKSEGLKQVQSLAFIEDAKKPSEFADEEVFALIRKSKRPYP